MAGEPRFVREFSDLLRQSDPRRFRTQWHYPVLIGVGIIGELAAHKQSNRRTHAMAGTTEYVPAESLLDRVWLVRRGDQIRPDNYITLGQKQDCDIVIPEYTLSSRHCAFSRSAPLRIADLGSLNGTRLNGRRLDHRELYEVPNGSEVVLARLKFLCLSADGFIDHLRAAG